MSHPMEFIFLLVSWSILTQQYTYFFDSVTLFIEEYRYAVFDIF